MVIHHDRHPIQNNFALDSNVDGDGFNISHEVDGVSTAELDVPTADIQYCSILLKVVVISRSVCGYGTIRNSHRLACHVVYIHTPKIYLERYRFHFRFANHTRIVHFRSF